MMRRVAAAAAAMGVGFAGGCRARLLPRRVDFNRPAASVEADCASAEALTLEASAAATLNAFPTSDLPHESVGRLGQHS